MTPRQSALLKYHLDTARLLTSDREPVFWVLDLEDSEGFAMACGLGNGDKARVRDARDSIRSTDCIPAQTAITSLESANRCFQFGWNIPPLAAGKKYMAVVSDGSLTVAAI